MKTSFLLGIAVTVLLGVMSSAQAALTPISGSIGFNVNFSTDSATLLNVTSVSVSDRLALATGTSGPLGTYLSQLGANAKPSDKKFNDGSALDFTTLGPATTFTVYSFTYNNKQYSMVNTAFDYEYRKFFGNNLSLTLYGLGIAYIKDLSGHDLYSPTYGSWILNGIQAAGQANPTWTFNTYVNGLPVPVPEPTTLISGMLLLLPAGVGVLRLLVRRRRKS